MWILVTSGSCTRIMQTSAQTYVLRETFHYDPFGVIKKQWNVCSTVTHNGTAGRGVTITCQVATRTILFQVQLDVAVVSSIALAAVLCNDSHLRRHIHIVSNIIVIYCSAGTRGDWTD